MQKMSKDTEKRISEALDKVAALVTEGITPSDAVFKVASNTHMPKGHVELLSRAYNTGQTLGHINSHEKLLDKAADIPLVSADDVMERLFPTEVKTAAAVVESAAVSDDYDISPEFWQERLRQEKNAQAVLPRLVESDVPELDVDPYFAGRKAASGMIEANRDAAQARQDLNSSGYKVAGCLDKLRNYFREVDALPIESVRENCQLLLGKAASNVLEKVASQLPRITQDAKLGFHDVDWTAAPYSLVRDVLDSFTAFSKQKAKTASAEQEAAEIREDLSRPFVESAPEDQVFSIWDRHDKQAALNPAAIGLAASIGGATKGITQSLLPDREEEVQKRVQRLEDPQHEDRLDNIRTQAMLTDLMTNDPVISTHPPDTVISAYNQLRDLTPEVANKRMSAQALLRRYLEQNNSLGEFELDQAAGLENKLRQQQPQQLQQQQQQPALAGTNNG
jgi:hypothetical protein